MFAAAADWAAAAWAAARAALTCPTCAAAACWACAAALSSLSLGFTGVAEAIPGATPRPTVTTAATPTTRVAQRLPVRRPVVLICFLTSVRTDPTPPLPGARCVAAPVSTSPGTPDGGALRGVIDRIRGRPYAAGG